MKNYLPLNAGILYEFFGKELSERLYFKVERLNSLNDGAFGKVPIKAGKITNETKFYVSTESSLELKGDSYSVRERATTQLR